MKTIIGQDIEVNSSSDQMAIGQFTEVRGPGTGQKLIVTGDGSSNIIGQRVVVNVDGKGGAIGNLTRVIVS